MAFLAQPRRFLRTVAGLRQWAQEPFVLEEAVADAQRLAGVRDDRFLSLARDAVYGFAPSPYLKLLRRIGCEYGDLEKEVRLNGVQATLQRLAAQGVYVTHDEMKGRQAARRGSDEYHFRAEDFDNPLVVPDFKKSTSGTTGRATPIGLSFEHFREQLAQTALSTKIHRVESAAVAHWAPPSGWCISRTLRMSKVIGGVDRWFSQLPLQRSRGSVFEGASTLGFTTLSRWLGIRIAAPEYVPMDEPQPVVDWMLAQRGSGRRAVVVTFPATAVRACLAASQANLSLDGVVFLIGGETITASKRQSIEDSGAVCVPLFGCTETGESGEGCLNPLSPDDMHLYEHKFVLASRRHSVGAVKDLETPLFTGLGRAAPKIVVNGDTGDAGTVERRDCGCPWGDLGYRTHWRDVWSYSKLTAEGMTLPGDEVYEILERHMPQRFGGGAGDYQLIAEPEQGGFVRYRLAVNPSVGPLDEQAVARAFREALAVGSLRAMAELLGRAGHLSVVRRAPMLQPGGKSLPVVLQRPAG